MSPLSVHWELLFGSSMVRRTLYSEAFMKHEYHEGPEAVAAFERLARAVLQVPKSAIPKRPAKKKAPVLRKKSGKERA